MVSIGFIDGLRALSEGFADILSFGEYSASKARKARRLSLDTRRALKTDKDAMAGDFMTIYKDMAVAIGKPHIICDCPICKSEIEIACGVGYCFDCSTWFTTKNEE